MQVRSAQYLQYLSVGLLTLVLGCGGETNGGLIDGGGSGDDGGSVDDLGSPPDLTVVPDCTGKPLPMLGTQNRTISVGSSKLCSAVGEQRQKLERRIGNFRAPQITVCNPVVCTDKIRRQRIYLPTERSHKLSVNLKP